MTRQVSTNFKYLPSLLRDGDGNGAEINATTAKAIEFWLNVTALGAGGDYDFKFETSMYELADGSTVWKEQVTTVNVVATGLQCVTLNRIDHALGVKARLSWVKNTTTATFDVKTVILE